MISAVAQATAPINNSTTNLMGSNMETRKYDIYDDAMIFQVKIAEGIEARTPLQALIQELRHNEELAGFKVKQTKIVKGTDIYMIVRGSEFKVVKVYEVA